MKLLPVLALLSLAAGGEPPEAREREIERLKGAALDLLLERQRELLRIHEPIRLAAVDLCGSKLSPVLGVVALSEEELPDALREIGRERLRLEDGTVRVVYTLPGFAADTAGVRAGDRVLTVEGRRLSGRTRLEALHSGGMGETLAVEIEREGGKRVLEIPNRPGCFSPARLIPMDYAVAFVDQSGRAYVTSALMRVYPRADEIAVSLGHEIAHYVLGHHGSRPPYETDADYLGLYIAARAGYDVSVAADYFRSRGLSTPFALDLGIRATHPNSAARTLALRETIEEIRAKQARGDPLIPEPAR